MVNANYHGVAQERPRKQTKIYNAISFQMKAAMEISLLLKSCGQKAAVPG